VRPSMRAPGATRASPSGSTPWWTRTRPSGDRGRTLGGASAVMRGLQPTVSP
jgi:hypothetical protein